MGGHFSSFLDGLKEVPTLIEELGTACGRKTEFTVYNKCLKILQSFQKLKLLDGLTIIFYVEFRSLIGKYLVT